MAADTVASFDTTNVGFFGERFKQVGFLVSDLQLQFYLVNYKFLTDFSQMSHKFLTHFFPVMAEGRKYVI